MDGKVIGCLNKLVSRIYLTHQANLLSFPGINDTAGEDHLDRLWYAHYLRKDIGTE